eukprot:SAG22_NODE_6619_length_831_cov_0.905738_1_plen_25_part_10
MAQHAKSKEGMPCSKKFGISNNFFC